MNRIPMTIKPITGEVCFIFKNVTKTIILPQTKTRHLNSSATETDNNWIHSFFHTLHEKDYSALIQKLDRSQIPINRKMKTGWTSYGGRLKWRQFSMQTLLHLTSAHGDGTACKIVLDHGGDPYITNREDENCFDVAIGDAPAVLKKWKKDKRWHEKLKWLLVPYFLDERCTLAVLPLEVIGYIAAWL